MENRIIVSYTAFKAKNKFWESEAAEQSEIMQALLGNLQPLSEMTSHYQVFPTRTEFDFFTWLTDVYEDTNSPNAFYEKLAKAINPFRQYFDLPYILTGLTNPSIYSRAKSKQEIEPFEDERTTYFVIYPFSKTTAWYLKSREERQELMNHHIKIGKQYREIKQLLLYSYGIQDQEFIVAYEMEDLALFSNLVRELRSTVARDYTLLDTPIITGLHRSPEALIEVMVGNLVEAKVH